MSVDGSSAEQSDVLARPGAGHAAIRGGIISLAGYGVSTVIGTATSIVLLRYLGVEDFGRYATVIAIVGLVHGLADPGVSTVGQRGYVVAVEAAAARGLLANIVGIRLALTPIVAALAVAFTAGAGYGWTIVGGVAIGGIGALLALLTVTALIPATAELRFTAITGMGIARDASSAAFLLALVVVGARLFPFLVVPALAALVGYAISLFIAGRTAFVARFSWTEWKPILRQSLPIGVAAVISVLYLRALLIVTSLTASEVSTGLYATSDRLIQIVVGGAGVMFFAAFPIIVRAGGRDEERRLVYAQQQLFDVALFVAISCVLVFAIAARPIVLALGGETYAGSAPILRIQCFALLGAFLSAIWLPTLIAVQKQRALIVSMLVGVTTIVGMGALLIPAFGITGTAITAVLGEAAIALAALVALIRARPTLRPRLRTAGKLVVAGLLCSTIAFAPGIPAAVAAAVAAVSFALLAWVTGAISRDPLDALRGARRQRP